MCEVSKQCCMGRFCAFVAGYYNEIAGTWDVADIIANRHGRSCYNSSNCEDCCNAVNPDSNPN